MHDDQIDLVFKALAHTERRRILASLVEKPGQSLFEICAGSMADKRQPLSRQTISQHLDALENAGLLDITWKGRTKAHSINLNPLRLATREAINRYL